MLTSKAFLYITKFLKKFKTIRYRFALMALVMVAADVAIVLQPMFDTKTYALTGAADSLLPKKDATMGTKLSFDTSKQLFNFSSSGIGASDGSKSLTTTPSVKAELNNDLSKGVTVTDTTNNVSLTMKPLFKHAVGKKDGNRIVYPLQNGKGWTVYTVGSTGLKEDIVLTSPDSQDTKTFSYDLSLGEGLIAKLEVDGSLGIYGNTLLSGQITTGNDADAKLLQAARKNTAKDTLLFTLPKPTIIETGKKKSSVTAHYQLNGTQLDVVTSGLKSASYPLSIDPTVLVTTASQFMAGNNETNINFDVSNQLIKKSPVTGARFNSWNSTTALPANPWASGAAAAGGYIYSVGGISFQGQTFNSQGASSFIVPTGITSINVVLWGGGGGGGGGAASSAGGIGGGAGALQSTLAVTPGETLSVYVGGGGGGGIYSSGGNSAGGGGGGGGFSSIYRGATALALVAGGGGAGGARSALAGGDGGAGGGTSGITGAAGGTTTAGGPGTASAGGSAGAGAATGIAGSSLTGGNGGDGRASQSSGSGVAGGGASGGTGGAPNLATTRAGGGGGGSGYFGGGGGGGTANSNSASGSGGGGGSSYSDSASTNVTNSAGSSSVPGNSTNTNRSGAGTGGSAGIATGNGSFGSGGLIAISYGAASTTSNTVNWAQFNTTTGTVDSTNPGNGTCSGWCTNSAYNLPSARSNFTLVAYSGFLYAFGGIDGTGTRTNTVYIAKLGANGEPRLWHPTSTDKTTWGFWYQDTALSSARSDMSVSAYNNRMYLVGGRSTGTTVLSSVEIANINPNGTLGTWATSTPLPTTTYGHSAKIYNDRMYILGGATSIGGAPVATVQYIKINPDGTLNSWVATTSLPEGRMNNGGDFATVWGGYLYASGGCTTTNTSGYCSSTLSTTKVASLNTDGSLDTWSNMAGASDQRTGLNLLAWAGSIYEVGGCSIQNTTTGACSTSPSSTINYGTINQDGDVSSVSSSVASTTGTCSGVTPTGCNLPGVASIGNILTSSFIANGYLYVVGGCTTVACTTTTGNVAYVAISSTGQMSKPATCPSGAYQGSAWCVDTVNTVAGGIAAASPVVFNNRVYLVGGLNGTANTNAIVYTTLNNDGSITAWTSQSMTVLGLTSVSYLFAYTRASPASASTTPGNLYVFGGCAASAGASCSAYSQAVYKCNIQVAGALTGCTTTGQLQLGIIPGDSAPGLGIMSGAVYANYIYLLGGVSPNQVDLATVRYAKFDASNNIVTTSTGWTESSSKMVVGRRLAAAYAYNGYLYVLGGYNATNGTLADVEFIKINVSDGSIGTAGSAFVVSAVTITQRWGLSAPISNSYAYIIGGCATGGAPAGCTAATDTIQSFEVYNNNSGAPAGFTTSANTFATSPNRLGASSAILNGYLYTAGGCTSVTDCTTAINTVSYAALDVNGNVGIWANTTATLPAVRAYGSMRVAGTSLYYMGGQSSTATDRRAEVYYATPSAGNITTWGTATNGLPAGRTEFGGTTWNNRLYVVGGSGIGTGCTTSNVCNTVYVSPQLNTGGDITAPWSTASTSLSVARNGATAVAYSNNLYVMGGYDGANYLADVQYSQLSSTDGSAGNWQSSASLPTPISDSDGFAANGYLYLMGGRSTATTCNPIALIAPISANSTIASGNNPTGIGEWYQTNQKYSGARYGASAVYNDGKAYIIGGACGSTLTYASPVVQQTPVLSQPQVAKYSISIDTDSEVYPAYWLLNGVDNGIGANWQLRYRSMTNNGSTTCSSTAMTTWGAETIFGNVTLGLPGVYIPKNAAGTSTSCARYYYFSVSVDSSQAFGYPDDVTRGPTITDLTLQFSADPSKRLIHGKTFTGGLQQPLDTPLY